MVTWSRADAMLDALVAQMQSWCHILEASFIVERLIQLLIGPLIACVGDLSSMIGQPRMGVAIYDRSVLSITELMISFCDLARNSYITKTTLGYGRSVYILTLNPTTILSLQIINQHVWRRRLQTNWTRWPQEGKYARIYWKDLTHGSRMALLTRE